MHSHALCKFLNALAQDYVLFYLKYKLEMKIK